MNTRMLRALGVLILSMSILWHTLAARASDADEARKCAEVADGTERLACYDRIFGRPARTGQDATATSLVADSKASDLREMDRRGFGLSEASKRQSADLPTAPDSIDVTIQSSKLRPTGEQVFTTDAGQVWVEVEPSPNVRVDPGDTVTIRKGVLGSYMLVTPQRVGTKVRRVK